MVQESISNLVEPAVVIRKREKNSKKGQKTGSWMQWHILTAMCAGTEVGLGGRKTMDASLPSVTQGMVLPYI